MFWTGTTTVVIPHFYHTGKTKRLFKIFQKISSGLTLPCYKLYDIGRISGDVKLLNRVLNHVPIQSQQHSWLYNKVLIWSNIFNVIINYNLFEFWIEPIKFRITSNRTRTKKIEPVRVGRSLIPDVRGFTIHASNSKEFHFSRNYHVMASTFLWSPDYDSIWGVWAVWLCLICLFGSRWELEWWSVLEHHPLETFLVILKFWDFLKVSSIFQNLWHLSH